MQTLSTPRPFRILVDLVKWLDTNNQIAVEDLKSPEQRKVNWMYMWPFAFLHLGCLGAFWTGASAFAITLALMLYFIRIFGVTAFYHRYCSHRTYKTSRLVQFLMAVMTMMAVQKGPLWWAAHHRHHHRNSDATTDIHSPLQRGFWYSHIGWIASEDNLTTDYSQVPDLAKFPELVFLNRFDWLVPVLLMAGLYFGGEAVAAQWPALQTSGLQCLVWGFFISTTIVFHATGTINSLAHVYGSQPYETGDTSRNNFWLALLTFGEGWHNNHHYYKGSVRQGFHWWQIDITFYILKMMSWVGLVWDLHPVPEHILRKQPTVGTGTPEPTG